MPCIFKTMHSGQKFKKKLKTNNHRYMIYSLWCKIVIKLDVEANLCIKRGIHPQKRGRGNPSFYNPDAKLVEIHNKNWLTENSTDTMFQSPKMPLYLQTTPNGRIGRLAHLNPNTQLPNAESQQRLFSERDRERKTHGNPIFHNPEAKLVATHIEIWSIQNSTHRHRHRMPL